MEILQEIWEVSDTEAELKHALAVLSLLTRSPFPHFRRPKIKRYYDKNQRGKDAPPSRVQHLLLEFPAETLQYPLHRYIQRAESRHPEVKLKLALQLLNTVAYLHRQGVYHRFLSSDDVLVAIDERSGEIILKVSSFLNCATSSGACSTYISVRNYRSPELLLQVAETANIAALADNWSVGCLLFEIFVGEEAFSLVPSRENGVFRPMLIKQQIDTVIRCIGQLQPSDIPPSYPRQYHQFLLGVKHEGDLATRMRHSVAEGEDSEQVDLWVELVQGFLCFDPRRRMTAEEGRRHRLFRHQKELTRTNESDVFRDSVSLPDYPIATSLDELLR